LHACVGGERHSAGPFGAAGDTFRAIDGEKSAARATFVHDPLAKKAPPMALQARAASCVGAGEKSVTPAAF